MKLYVRASLLTLFVVAYTITAIELWRFYKRTTVVWQYAISYPDLHHKLLFGPLSLIEGNFYAGKAVVPFLVSSSIVFLLLLAVTFVKYRFWRVVAIMFAVFIWCIMGVRFGGFMLG